MTNVETLMEELEKNKNQIDTVIEDQLYLSLKFGPLYQQIDVCEKNIENDQRNLAVLKTQLAEHNETKDELNSYHNDLIANRRQLMSAIGELGSSSAIEYHMKPSTDQQEAWTFFKDNQMIFFPASGGEEMKLKLDLYQDVNKLAEFIPLLCQVYDFCELDFYTNKPFRLEVITRLDCDTAYRINNVHNGKSYVNSTDLVVVLNELKEMCGF